MAKYYVWLAVLGAVVVPRSSTGQSADSCPSGRSLKRQIAAADIVVLGEVVYDRDCKPPRFGPSQRPYSDCFGRRANMIVRRIWKGPLTGGSHVALVMPVPGDSAGVLFKKGETRVLFAQTGWADSVLWSGYTNACMYPEGVTSEKTLIKQLDAWKRKQPKTP